MQNLQASERRRSNRIPARIAITVRDINNGATFNAESVDLTPFGAQIESNAFLVQKQQVEIWPYLVTPEAPAHAVKGCIKWVKPMNGKYKSGISFDEQADWPVRLSDLTTGYDKNATEISMINSILTNLEDGILIMDHNMNILAANPSQPFCPHIKHTDLMGKSLDTVSDFLDIVTPGGRIRDIIHTVLKTGKSQKVTLAASNKSKIFPGSKSSYLIKRVMLPGFKTGIIIRAKRIASSGNQQATAENGENLWLNYNYTTLEQLLDGLIEDISNPLCTAVGRLDLMAIKIKNMTAANSENAVQQFHALQSEINTVQSVLMQITEFCRAAIRRRKETHGENRLFSLNSLINDELKTMELHSQFRSIKKEISLQHSLPLTDGDYSDWVNTFVAICQTIIRQLSTLRNKELTIKTYQEDGANVLSFTHNGKALSLDIEKDPTLAILKLLQQKYNAGISIHGSTGNQTITIKTKPADIHEPKPGEQKQREHES